MQCDAIDDCRKCWREQCGMNHGVRNLAGQSRDHRNGEQSRGNQRQSSTFAAAGLEEHKAGRHAHQELREAYQREEFHHLDPRGVDIRVGIHDTVRPEQRVSP